MDLSHDELDAIVQQSVQVLGISSRSVLDVRMERGSGRIVLQLNDLIAASQLFLMAQKGDPNLMKFFDECKISIDDFITANAAALPRLKELREEEQARQPDELDQKVSRILPPDGLRVWAGNATVTTFSLVFTEILDSAKLCSDLGDTMWDSIIQLHFAHTHHLIAMSSGCFIKNTGDGILAAFHYADDSVTFGQEIYRNTGHAVIRVRAGVHIGQVTIDGDDTFGHHVNLAARVTSMLKHEGLMITDAVKSDLTGRGTESLNRLCWEKHPDIQLKGVPDPLTLWELQDGS
jgi:class 3 adenylate cyclase